MIVLAFLLLVSLQLVSKALFLVIILQCKFTAILSKVFLQKCKKVCDNEGNSGFMVP